MATGTLARPARTPRSPSGDFGNLDYVPFREHPKKDSAHLPFLETVPPCWNRKERNHNCCTGEHPALLQPFPERRDVSPWGRAHDVTPILMHGGAQGRAGLHSGETMRRAFQSVFFLTLYFAATAAAFAQNYQVIQVTDGGTISGTVKWAGPLPHNLDFPVIKDPQVCDPDSRKTTDLERLIVGPKGGVANTIVYLKNISSGKAMDLPEQRRHLDQKQCHYVPHILLVPQNSALAMQSSDATLHTIHMDGAASFNLPFPFQNQPTSRTMSTPGLVHLHCNGGHVWMNAEMMVVTHPYYAVTDDSGQFEFTNVPPGTYQIVAWHEGWGILGRQQTYDVLTEKKVDRPLFSEPKTWEKSVTVTPNQPTTVNFIISSK